MLSQIQRYKCLSPILSLPISSLTSLVELSTNGPPNMAAIQSQLEISRGLWALMVPSSRMKVTSVQEKRHHVRTQWICWRISPKQSLVLTTHLLEPCDMSNRLQTIKLLA